MRHGKKDNHLSRTHSHREAMLQNMASSLILHKRIETTVAKAKELRKFVEPILTRAKDDTYQNRRVVFQIAERQRDDERIVRCSSRQNCQLVREVIPVSSSWATV